MHVSDALCLQGMVTGDTAVGPGAVLELLGTCCGNLTIEADGAARIDGIVVGNIENRGGKLTVRGVVNGTVTTHAGVTEIDPAAVVDGGTRTAAQ